MLLHHVDTGSGDRIALLLHGMMGSGESWWRVADVLAADGYRVVALDLPGHGLSPRDPLLTIERAADAVVQTVRALTNTHPALAIGHSYGGRILAAAADRLQPEHAVYVDSPFGSGSGYDRDLAFAEYEQDRAERTVDLMRATKPHYGERDLENEARAAERFDSETAAAVASSGGSAAYPQSGSLVIRADPSDYVSDEAVARLQATGVTVRSIPAAAHSLWYSHFDAFISALDGWR